MSIKPIFLNKNINVMQYVMQIVVITRCYLLVDHRSSPPLLRFLKVSPSAASRGEVPGIATTKFSGGEGQVSLEDYPIGVNSTNVQPPTLVRPLWNPPATGLQVAVSVNTGSYKGGWLESVETTLFRYHIVT